MRWRKEQKTFTVSFGGQTERLDGERSDAWGEVVIICREAFRKVDEATLPLVSQRFLSMGKATVWSGVSSRLSHEAGRAATCVESSKSFYPAHLGLWSDSLCCTLLEEPASLVTRRHLLQPSVRLCSARDSPVHAQAGQWHVWLGNLPSNHLYFASHTSAASCHRLCSPFRASAPVW